jgi:hypothetical protein
LRHERARLGDNLMWIRSAFWEGQLRPGQEKVFFAEMQNAIVPAMRKLPGVTDVKALWPRVYEDRPRDVMCQLLVFFKDEADIALMIASDARNAVRRSVAELNSRCFDGLVSHINYEYDFAHK